MKMVFLITLSVWFVSIFGQTTKFIFITESELNDYPYVEHNFGLSECVTGEKSDSIVLIKITGISPESTSKEKLARINEIDKIIDCFESFGKCTFTHIIIIQIPEALYLDEKDKLELFSKQYQKNGPRVNISHFMERYEEKLKKWFPGKTVVLANWNW